MTLILVQNPLKYVYLLCYIFYAIGIDGLQIIFIIPI